MSRSQACRAASQSAKSFELLRKTALCSALATALGIPQWVQAQSPRPATTEAASDYAIPAGPLATTLREIARVSGRNIRFETRDVQDRMAPAVVGARETVAAVQQAISGSGLTMTTQANGDIVVFVPELDKVMVTAERGEAETGFRASRSDTATRAGADLLDVPQAVTIVTAKVIETQQALSVQEVLQNVAGVVTRESQGGLPGYTIRGFSQNSALSNGVSDPYAARTNIAGVDRVEVLKGPQAILSGGDTLGGAVNIVAKKPTAEKVRDLTLQYGSHADRTATIDLAGAISDDKRLSYRLIGSAARSSRTEAGFNGRENDYLLAQLRWKDSATDVTAGVSYDNEISRPGRYTFALNGGIQRTPLMRLGSENDGVHLRSRSIFYDLEHAFSPNITFVSRLKRSLTMQDLQLTTARYPLSTQDMLINYGVTSDVTDYQTTSGDHYLRLNFETGPLSHTLSTGINHTSRRSTTNSYSGTATPVPVYQDAQFAFPGLERNASTLYSINQSESEQRALFVQDLVRLGNWSAMVGLRRTSYKSGPFSNRYLQSNSITSGERKSLSQTSPSVGLIYNLSANSSVYASYAEGFTPQFVTVSNCSGATDFDPMETVNKEIGFKHNSEDGAFAFSTAVYQLDQNNRLELDRAQNCYYQRGATRVRGFEFEASGRLAKGLNMIANYTYTSSKDRFKDTDIAGAQPRHQVSLWSTYDFQSPALNGFGVSAGITAYSKSLIGTTAGSPVVPGGARVDVGASYAADDWSLRLGVKNLFDRDLYGYTLSTLFVPVQQGRTATLTYRKSF